MGQVRKLESLSSPVLGSNIYGIRTNSSGTACVRHGVPRRDVNGIIEHVELNFNVNVVVDVSHRPKRFPICSRYTEKSRGPGRKIIPLSGPVTLIIKRDVRFTIFLCPNAE